MLKPLPGFRSSVTHHCVTGSLRHIYEFHSHPSSEEMLLGLGAGVSWLTWNRLPGYGWTAWFVDRRAASG